MATVTTSLCYQRDRLYEEYERVVLKRIARRKSGFALMKRSQLKSLEHQIAEALQQLREHERLHHCH